MADPSDSFIAQTGRTGMVRLRTLVILRWLAIIGQFAAILYTFYVLHLGIDLGLCLMAIGASVIANLVLGFVYPENRRLPEREVMLMLLFDLCQLAFLLYLTGGLNNPFALLILAPVTVSAMTLHSKSTILIGATAVVIVCILTVVFVPLRNELGYELRMPKLFVYGFWFALVIGIIFLAIYARRVTEETFAMNQALLATQMALSREQQLTALGGVVAAAAHELGTPLATIKLASAELLEELDDRPDLKEDAVLIRDQADRCRDILRSMGQAGKDDLHLRIGPLSAVIEEAAAPHEDRGKQVHFSFEPSEGHKARIPDIRRRPEIIHGLRNLIQNAVDFAAENVWIDARWNSESISIRVIDDGKGYPPEVLGRIGDPFIRRRTPAKRLAERPEYEGMGLGLFIAKTLLERSGADVSFANGSKRASTRGGAIADIVWPVEKLTPLPGDGTGLGENQPNPV